MSNPLFVENRNIRAATDLYGDRFQELTTYEKYVLTSTVASYLAYKSLLKLVSPREALSLTAYGAELSDCIPRGSVANILILLDTCADELLAEFLVSVVQYAGQDK